MEANTFFRNIFLFDYQYSISDIHLSHSHFAWISEEDIVADEFGSFVKKLT
jgi:hypothetical protein